MRLFQINAKRWVKKKQSRYAKSMSGGRFVGAKGCTGARAGKGPLGARDGSGVRRCVTSVALRLKSLGRIQGPGNRIGERFSVSFVFCCRFGALPVIRIVCRQPVLVLAPIALDNPVNGGNVTFAMPMPPPPPPALLPPLTPQDFHFSKAANNSSRDDLGQDDVHQVRPHEGAALREV